MNRFYTILIFVILSTSCKKEASNNIAKEKLLGTWEFKSSKGGITGMDIIVPPSGTTITLSLSADNTFEKKSNDQIQAEGKYALSIVNSSITNQNADAIQFDGSPLPRLFVIRNDSLIISDNHPEGYGDLFLKIK